MPIPKNKAELIHEIEASYIKLKLDLINIPADQAVAKELAGHAKGTEMSVSNVVSYLIGWGELVLKWNQKKERLAHVDFPETGYKWNELGRLAQKFYVDYEHLNYEDLLTRLDSVVDQILNLIQKSNNADLYEQPWYGKWTKGKMIQLNTSSPYKNARTRVRKWKRQRAE
ncbi:MAG: ClbS/DfsB family four-helix bundle protein [Crocinitomicaceae bacterium]|nr:ClbS/DfsB family four-helix bundle protein [Crocinitomicaceae bacterium]MDG1777007.1 ClbS/DfsB family four-helix bundle protein [Crocinitomicaceae bacterium]